MSTAQDAYARALDLQARAAAVGFDWPDLAGILDKAAEELAELRDALVAGAPSRAISEEMGDLLFVLMNLARRLELAPDTVLEAACDKFERRFAFVRARLADRGLTPEQAGLEELERLWEMAKGREGPPEDRLPKPL